MRKRPFESFREVPSPGKMQSAAASAVLSPRAARGPGRDVDFQVNTTLDTLAVNLRTGKDSSGHISLRSAIMAADAKGGSNTIKLKSGVYKLTIAGANEDASVTGDLDITSNLTIEGSGSRGTIIDGNNLDRVIEVLSGKVNISGVTIEHGLANTGGGLLNNGGRVPFRRSLSGNRALGSSGAQGANWIGSTAAGARGGNGTDGTPGLGGGLELSGVAEHLEQQGFREPGDWR